jgi:hypothetical protein
MAIMNLRILMMAGIVVGLTACNMENTTKSRGPITLGDSSTIVTETDPEALRDLVPDLRIPEEPNADTVAPALASQDSSTKAPEKPALEPSTAVSGKGLNVAFRELTIFIPDISTRSYSKADLKKARSATYALTDGKLAGAKMQVSGATITGISQRYETIITLQKGGKELPLESLGKYTSAWQTLAGSQGSYLISGLEPGKLGFKQASAASIRNAVQQAARRQRISRSETQEWVSTARNIRAANQPPAKVVLRSVMWRIEGKDAAGKSFTKELRIDL